MGMAAVAVLVVVVLFVGVFAWLGCCCCFGGVVWLGRVFDCFRVRINGLFLELGCSLVFCGEFDPGSG